jgi:prophage regulatory protein
MNICSSKERFLSLHEVVRITSLGKSTIYEMVRLGQFPAPISISARRRAWVESEVQAWIAARVGRPV